MRDPVVIRSLNERGVNYSNIEEVIIYEGIERKPRHLDKAPKRLMMVRDQNKQVYGCYGEFVIAFDSLKNETDIEQGTIDLRGNIRHCDPDVYIALKTLVSQGYCGVEERATSCFELFKCIATAPGDYLSVKTVYSALRDYVPSGYYAKELLAALHKCLFNEKAPVLYWYRIGDCLGYYRLALKLGAEKISQNCEDEKAVDSYLRDAYKAAFADKEFMSQVYKKASNKHMTAMLYLLKDEHPEALEPTSTGGGFSCSSQ